MTERSMSSHQLAISSQTTRREAARCGADSHSRSESYVVANHPAQPALSAQRGRRQNDLLMRGGKL